MTRKVTTPVDRMTIAFGAFFGLIVPIPFLMLLNAMGLPSWQLIFSAVALTIGFATVAIYVFKSMQEILPWYKNGDRHR